MIVNFAGNEIDLGENQVKPCDMAPEFKAIKNDMGVFDSKNTLGKTVVYSVVPSIDTGVCSLQTRHFNEEAEKFGDNLLLVTISCDLPFAQKRFCATEGINNSITVSDYRFHDFGKKYGFLMDDLKLLSRGVVIVDKEGKVAYAEYIKEVSQEVDFEKALEVIKELI